MSSSLPYMASVTNVPAILDRMRGAGTPPRFTHDFLKASLGFASSSDRAFIKILKQLNFLDADGTPTSRYNEFKGSNGNQALAKGLRDGWSSLFLADQNIHTKNPSLIQSTVKSVTGASDAVSKKIASTFKALADIADWTNLAYPETETSAGTVEMTTQGLPNGESKPSEDGGIRLHHDIHIHLPPTSDVSVYRAIFQAIKAELI